MFDNMKAKSLLSRRVIVAEQAFAELVLWELAGPVPPCGHNYKYRLAYVVSGQCVVRYDNERGKGDHRHWGDQESEYQFSDVDQLVADFYADMRRWNDEYGNA